MTVRVRDAVSTQSDGKVGSTLQGIFAARELNNKLVILADEEDVAIFTFVITQG